MRKRAKTPPPEGPRQVIGYVRVSTERQAAEGGSLPEQEHKIRAWAAFRGLEVRAVYSDALSGARADNRPGLNAALAAVKECRGVLVFASLSRLGRSLIDLASIAEDLEAEGADFASLSEDLNTASPSGRLVFKVLGALCEYEREIITARVVDGLRARQREGRRTGGIPYGLDLAPDGTTLTRNEDEQKAIAFMVERRAAGATLLSIVAELERLKVRTKKGAKWSAKVVADVLRRAQRAA